MGLLLAAVDIEGPLRWRWLLTDGVDGPPLADHPVDLRRESAEVARFADLYRYVRSYAAPDRVVSDGARFVAESGAWAGRELLGESIGSAILAATGAGPLTVRVHVPAGLDRVLLWPLELAHANGIPLAARGDVTLVYDIATAVPADKVPADKAPAAKNEAGEALRVLAVFSQPTKTSILALRRERYALSQLIRQIGRKNAVVLLQVVQYGVTRDRLAEIADDGDGWDVLHLSGHGAGGVFTLERSDGSPDPVPTATLIELLRPARRRVRLAVVSACESAAAATAETYRLLGLTEQAEALEAESADGGHRAEVRDLARLLARELGCAVVGMRYPVADEFAIKFGSVLYRQLLSKGNPVDAAVACAVAEAAGPSASAARPAVSLATPGVFGSAAIGLKLTVPHGQPVLDPAVQRMAYFPDEPERFVGRADAMAQASAALASGSGKTAVLLHGMAGAGKTACALELAYRHQDAFAAAAFWQAPTREDEWASGLADFANRLDIQFADYGFTMASHIGTTQHLAAFLPRLRALLANQGLLLVLDNLETLLTPDGHWRDPRWEQLITALTGHNGESRTILTSRIASAGLTASSGVPSGSLPGRVVTLPVHALSLDEAVGLARELPNLRALLYGDSGSIRVVDPDVSDNADGDRADSGADANAAPAIAVSQPEPEAITKVATQQETATIVIGAAETHARTESVAASPGPRPEPEAVAWAAPEPEVATGVTRTQTASESVAAAEADRGRVLRVLRVVQGHPKLMELADAAAANRDRLDAQLAAAEAAARETGGGPGLEAFFRDGTTSLDPEQFLDALTKWTKGALGVLSPEARLMAEFVACLEDGDRLSFVIDATWADLWRRLALVAEPSEPAPLLAVLASAALVQLETLDIAETSELPTPVADGDAGQPKVPVVADAIQQEAPAVADDGELPMTDAVGVLPSGAHDGMRVPVAYRVHPGVAAAIMAAAGPGVREAADIELATFWGAVSASAREREGGEDGAVVVRAGLAAAPYLLRRGDWGTAGFLLERATMRDQSPGTVQAALPSLRRIADATGAPDDIGVLASVLRAVDPGEAERLLRAVADAAAGAGDYRVASANAGDLVYLLLETGRLAEALAAAGEKAEHTRRAGLGPWTQLADQGRSLQVLGRMGEHAQVLAETDQLRAAMAALPARRGPDETVNPWNVRETILSAGYASALATGDWARCLELNAEATASKRGRGARAHEIARSRFNDAGPLIRLGRPAEAGRLLLECQRVFEEHADIASLARVLSARADLEDELGRWPAAADLERAALRLSYARPDPQAIAVSHHNLANYLGRLGGDGAGRRAHRLAAALIRRLAGMAHDLARTVRALAAESRADDGGGLPSTVAEVVTAAERTEGVRLGALLAALQPDPRAVADALAGILAAAAELPPDDAAPDLAGHLREWEPVIAAVAAACQPGRQAPPELLEFLDEQAGTPDWVALAAVLHRILDGERGESLLDGLDPIDTAIARETLARIAQSR